jgi:hypothetical protein
MGGITPGYFLASMLNFCISRITFCLSSWVLAVRGRTSNLYLIGDSGKSQNIMNAVWDAYEVSRMV